MVLSRIALGCLIAIGAASPASAFTLFSDRASFEAANNLTVETFEGEAVAGPQNGFDFSGFDVLEAGGPPDARVADVFGALSPKNGDRFLAYTEEANSGSSFLFDNFTPGSVNAFGFDIAVDELPVVFTVRSGAFEIATFRVQRNAYSFFGFSEIDFLIEAVVVTAAPDDGGLLPGEPLPDVKIGFDDVSFGQVQAAVPLPAALPLLLAGLGVLGLGAATRRGRR